MPSFLMSGRARAALLATGLTLAVLATPAPAAAQTVRYVGPARNGSLSGTAQLDLTVEAGSGRARGALRFANGLSGDAQLSGQVRNGAIRLEGVLVYSGARYAMNVDARTSSGGVLGGVYLLTPQGGGATQRGELRLTQSGGGQQPGATIASHQAQTVERHESTPIEEYRGTTIEPSRPVPHEDHVPPRGGRGADAAGAAAFVGTWQLRIWGAAYSYDNIAAGTRTHVASAGALADRLVISPDGSYAWGKQRGRWQPTGENPTSGWPLLLLKPGGRGGWKVGWDTRREGKRGDILVYDGMEYQVGSPVR